jgi:hypothetical protein
MKYLWVLLCCLPASAWSFFPTNVGTTLTATYTVVSSNDAPGATASAFVTPILIQPDGYLLMGVTATIPAGQIGTYMPLGSISIPNPELGTYLLGVQVVAPTGSNPTVALDNLDNTTMVSAGFNYVLADLFQPMATVASNTTTQVTVPVVYLPSGFPP